MSEIVFEVLDTCEVSEIVSKVLSTCVVSGWWQSEILDTCKLRSVSEVWDSCDIVSEVELLSV